MDLIGRGFETGEGAAPPPRAILLAMLKRARAAVTDIERQVGSNLAAVGWQRGYAKAVEEMLDVSGISVRRYPRQPTSLTADVRRLNGTPGTREQVGRGTITDLSRGGCGLATRVPLAADDRVEVTFTLPERRVPLARHGRVRRAQQAGDKTRAGVEFEEELPDWP
jgi:hypothetical protein